MACDPVDGLIPCRFECKLNFWVIIHLHLHVLVMALRRGKGKDLPHTMLSTMLDDRWKLLATLVCLSNPLTGTVNCANANVAQVSHQMIMARSSRETIATARQILECSAFL